MKKQAGLQGVSRPQVGMPAGVAPQVTGPMDHGPMDITNGMESQPIYVVNTVDDSQFGMEKEDPSRRSELFEYVKNCVIRPEIQVRHCLCLVFPLPSRLRQTPLPFAVLPRPSSTSPARSAATASTSNAAASRP